MWETGEGGQKTGERRPGKGDRRWETERGQETGDKKGERVLTSFPKNFAGQFTNF